MKRPLAVLVVLTVLAGCKGTTPFTDPFVGRTTVTPPGTGQMAGQGATNPYYTPPTGEIVTQPQPTAPQWLLGPQNGPTSPTGSTNPGTFRSPGSASGIPANPGASSTPPSGRTPQNNYRPPGGSYQYKGSSTGSSQPSGSGWARAGEKPPTLNRLANGNTLAASGSVSPANNSIGGSATIATNPAAATPSAVATVGSSGGQSTVGSSLGSSLAGRERIVRTIGPPPGGGTTRPAAVQPWPYPGSSNSRSTGRSAAPTLPTRAIDIMDLPPSRTSASTTDSNGVRLASASRKARSTPTADSFISSARYGHDPDYRWLKGKLEYSQIDQSWKLRYIPVEGETDDYGGSVVLDEKSLGSGLERGHFVEVQGRVAAGAEPERGYAPAYEVAELKRLGK